MSNPYIRMFKGEVNPGMADKVGSDYCRHLENFIPQKYGNIERRPGTRFIYKSEKPEGLLEEHDV